eukprot:TRINITY_DN4078_c0_g1_i16.p1 TRINITY_DN4078_c0_g1~~TRINITY_DN4078_c0_g1_i16.p1  ORF type:complete len:201 (+),score=9.95 TRINITY_DN4078_c0_g1_i16:148-750(+)
MIRRPPRSTHCISSAASDVYKRQDHGGGSADQRQVGRIGRQTQRIAIPAETQPALPSGPRRTPGREHGRRNIQPDQFSVGIACRQTGKTAATTATQIENPFGLQSDVIKALLHSAIDFADEKITFAIGRRNAGEASTDLLPVDETRIQICWTQMALTPRRANSASSRSISGLPVVNRKSPQNIELAPARKHMACSSSLIS